jgi:RNA-directed DNA polymerase
VNPPPFLISFPDAESLQAALEPNVRDTHWPEIEQLIEKGFPPAVSVRVLACMFGFSSKLVGAMRRKPYRYYRTFIIHKGKKKREIHAPKVALKVIQKWLSFHLAQKLQFDAAVFGFVAGKSAPQAAAVHSGAEWVYSLDIANFFPTTSQQSVTTALNGIGYSPHAAELISALCCYLGNLAQGSPASPMLSNLVFSPHDKLLRQIAESTDSRYTRYADDIVFSGTGDPPANIAELVRKVVTDAGWKVAEGKEHLAVLPHRLKVHGLLVHGEKPRLTKGYRNRIRAFSHLLQHGKVRPEDVPRLTGHLSYAKSVDSLNS